MHREYEGVGTIKTQRSGTPKVYRLTGENTTSVETCTRFITDEVETI